MVAGSLAHTAARAFHVSAAALLGFTESQKGAQAAVCRVTQESPSAYSTALKGREVSLERVCKWVQAWNGVADLVGLSLHYDGENVTVVATKRDVVANIVSQWRNNAECGEYADAAPEGVYMACAEELESKLLREVTGG